MFNFIGSDRLYKRKINSKIKQKKNLCFYFDTILVSFVDATQHVRRVGISWYFYIVLGKIKTRKSFSYIKKYYFHCNFTHQMLSIHCDFVRTRFLKTII